jgi:hypothetical protein
MHHAFYVLRITIVVEELGSSVYALMQIPEVPLL